MSSKRKITVDLPTSRKPRDRGDRMERSGTSDTKNSRDSNRSLDKERSDRNERSNDRGDDLNRSGDRERTASKTASSGSTGNGFQGDRVGSQRDRDRDRVEGGETQQQRASVFSRLGKGPVSSATVPKSGTAQQKGICRPYAENGQCPYGKECRFKHVTALVSPSKRSGNSHDSREAKEKDRDSGSGRTSQR